jgi:hypothetical protein
VTTVKSYRYVGPEVIRARAAHLPCGTPIESIADLKNWLRHAGQRPNALGQFVLTFVIDERGCLRVADRGSEHVACASGGPVLSAGELFLTASRDGFCVEEISNQSTGYCPEPESWPAVAAALDRIGMAHPGRFTQAVIFRRCPSCGERTIVKDGWFVCGLCDAELPVAWNFDKLWPGAQS